MKKSRILSHISENRLREGKVSQRMYAAVRIQTEHFLKSEEYFFRLRKKRRRREWKIDKEFLRLSDALMNTEEPKKCLYLCMGSACHQLGVYEVLPRIQELIKHYRLDVSVELKGSFCLGPCSDGIIMKFGDTLFTHIRPENVDDKFISEILPQLKAV